MLSISIQADALRRYPTGEIADKKGDLLVWRWEGKLSPLSMIYTIKLVYRLGRSPKVYVVSPKPLPLAKGEISLPHVYDNVSQQICLYYNNEDKKKEWSPNKIIANTIVPWIAEWLYFYEIWQYTGVWTGGGIHGGKIEN